jgi:hypothetical protein
MRELTIGNRGTVDESTARSRALRCLRTRCVVSGRPLTCAILKPQDDSHLYTNDWISEIPADRPGPPVRPRFVFELGLTSRKICRVLEPFDPSAAIGRDDVQFERAVACSM